MAATVAADRPQNAIDVADVADVGVSVRQKRPLLAVRLLRKDCEELTEGDFDLRFAAEGGDDGGVEGIFEQLVDSELFGGNFVAFNLRQEVLPHVVSEVANLHLGLLRSVDDEVLAGRKQRDGRNGDRGREAFEKLLCDRFRKHQLVAEEFQGRLLATHFFHNGVQLTGRQILRCKHDILLALSCALIFLLPEVRLLAIRHSKEWPMGRFLLG